MAFNQTDIDFFKKYNWSFQPQNTNEWWAFYDESFKRFWLNDTGKFGDETFKRSQQNFVGDWRISSGTFYLDFYNGNSSPYDEAYFDETQKKRQEEDNNRKNKKEEKKSTPTVSREIKNMDDFRAGLPKDAVKTSKFDCEPIWDDSENWFVKDFKPQNLNDAAKNFIKWFLTIAPNWFTGTKSMLCGYKSNGDLVSSTHEDYNTNVIKTLTKNKNKRGSIFGNKNNYDIWKMEKKDEINNWLKTPIVESLNNKLNNKKLEKLINKKLNETLNRKVLSKEKIKRKLMKISEHFYGGNRKKSMSVLLEDADINAINQNSISSDDKEYFTKTFNYLFHNSDNLLVDELLKTVFSILSISPESLIGKNIRSQFEGMTNTDLSELFLNCELVCNKIVDAIQPTVVSELPSEQPDSLMGMIHQSISDDLISQKTRETLKLKISQKICPQLTASKEQIMKISDDIKQKFTDEIV